MLLRESGHLQPDGFRIQANLKQPAHVVAGPQVRSASVILLLSDYYPIISFETILEA